MTCDKKECMRGICPCSEQDDKYISGESFDESVSKPALLLHSCCGPCSSAVIERLIGEFNITVFFFNPCISDEEEYKKRKASQIKLLEKMNEELAGMGAGQISFREGSYNSGVFFEAVRGHEDDPEGGERCSICFRQRLEETAITAGMAGCDYFGTTLTVSPHKSYRTISRIGRELALKYGVSFLDRDFKKKDGFKRSTELSRKYELYRQNYCGCKFSER